MKQTTQKRRSAAIATVLACLALAGLHAPFACASAPDYSRLFPKVFARHGPPQKQIALTFDDGPDDRYTPQILRVLAQEHVRATFFVLGVHARIYPGMVRRIVHDGHALGNHSYNHANLLTLTPQQVRWEVDKTEDILYRLTGTRTVWFRPPYGNVNAGVLRQMNQLGYRVVNWSVDSADWRSLPARRVLANVLSAAGPGAIVLQHCSGNSHEVLDGTVGALPAIIHALRARGYQLVTVPQLLEPDARLVHGRDIVKQQPPGGSAVGPDSRPSPSGGAPIPFVYPERHASRCGNPETRSVPAGLRSSDRPKDADIGVDQTDGHATPRAQNALKGR